MHEIFGGVPHVDFKNASMEEKLDNLQTAVENPVEYMEGRIFDQQLLRASQTVPGILVMIQAHPTRSNRGLVEFVSPLVISLATGQFTRLGGAIYYNF